MAKAFTVDLGQLVTVSGTSNLIQADVATATLYVRRYNAAGVYQEQFLGTNNGGGNWTFEVPDGLYQMWKSAHPDTTAGNRYDKWHGGSTKYKWVGDEALPYLPLVDDTTDYYDAGGLEVKNAANPSAAQSLVTKAFADANYLTTVTAQTTFYTETEVNTLLAAKVGTAGTWTMAGQLQTELIPKVTDSAGSDAGTLPQPNTPGHLIHLQYFNNNIPQYYQPNREIIVVPEATADVVGKSYRSILTAVAYANSQTPASNKVYTIRVNTMATLSEITAGTGSIKNYVHIVAAGRHIRIIVQENSLTLTQGMNIENATVFFGALDVTTDRVFVKFNLINCTVYHYRDITFNNSDLIGCRIIGSSTKILNYGGTTNIDRCKFRNNPNQIVGHTGEIDYQTFADYAVPTDPSVPL